MLCPSCKENLSAMGTRIELGPDSRLNGDDSDESAISIAVDVCLNCSGSWFNRESAKIYFEECVSRVNSEKIRSDLLDSRKKKPGLCPECSTVLFRSKPVKTSSLKLDACAACQGVWVESEFRQFVKLEIEE